MIKVSSPLKRDWMREFVTNLEYNGKKYEFVKEEKINLYFEIDTDDYDKAIRYLKDSVKASEYGKVLFFNISKE